MQTQLIKEIIYCSNDTITDRIALMRPVLISFTISVFIVAVAGEFYSYNVPTKELLIILFSMMVTCGLVQKIKKNPVIFISPFTMIVLSIIGMINEPNSNNWLIFQILSMMVINVIGSTRCNVINFLLVVLGPYIASFYGADMQTLYGTQIVLWALFPALLYSSYYRALFTIEKLNNLKHLHDLELKVVNEDKNAQLAQISSLIAHEVNNALAILVGNLHLIRKRYPDSISLVEKAEKNSSTMKKLFNKSNLNELTHEELTKLVDDKDVKDALGCGFLINDRDCNSWEDLKKDIDKNYKALLVEAKSNVDATEQKYLEKSQDLLKKTKEKAALEGIQRSDKTGPFFDKLNDLGMLSKLALMNAEQLKGHLDLGEAQLEVLKQKLGNSILGIVMNEKIDKKLEEQAAAIDQQIAAKTDILEAQIEHLRGNFCREATANPICSPLEAAIADGEVNKSATSGTSAAPAAPADTATQD